MTWMLSLVCNSVFTVVNLIIIVVTGTLRFSTIGKLCALNQTPIHYDSESGANFYSALDDSWTYEKDGQLIFYVWIA